VAVLGRFSLIQQKQVTVKTVLGSISLLQETGIWSRERRQEVATVTSYHESTVTYVAPTIRLEAILC